MSSAFRGARILLRAEAREAYGMVISEIRKENLRALIRECGGNASELCRRGPRLTSAYVSQILHDSPNDRTGRPRSMGDDLARRLEQHMHKPAGWMDTLHVAEVQASYGSNVAAAPQARGAVPVISWVQAGREMPSAMWEPEPDTHVLVARKYGPGTYALRVRGDSMVDIVGATIACRRAAEAQARYSVRWPEGWLAREFPGVDWHDREAGTLTYVGFAEFQNGFNAWTPYIIGCLYDPATDSVVRTEIKPGRP